MFLCKCSSGHVESSIDNIARKFAAKTQVFLVKVQKRRKNKCSRVFFSTLFLCTLRFMFRHTGLFFCQKQKKLTRSPKKDDTSINYFHHFFSKFCWGHVKCIFSNLPYFFLPKDGYFRSETEKDRTITLLSEKNLKTFRCTHRLQLWEFWQMFTPKVQYIGSTTKKLEQNFFIPKKRPKIFLWTLWM